MNPSPHVRGLQRWKPASPLWVAVTLFAAATACRNATLDLGESESSWVLRARAGTHWRVGDREVVRVELRRGWWMALRRLGDGEIRLDLLVRVPADREGSFALERDGDARLIEISTSNGIFPLLSSESSGGSVVTIGRGRSTISGCIAFDCGRGGDGARRGWRLTLPEVRLVPAGRPAGSEFDPAFLLIDPSLASWTRAPAPDLQKLTASVAVSHGNDKVRAYALDRVADLELVGQRAVADSSGHVRYCAVGRIANQAVLARIARSDSDPEVRLAAADRLQDRSLAREVAEQVAQSSRDSMARLRALERGERLDESVLTAIATRDDDAIVREAAVGQLDDPVLLAGIARDDTQEDVRSVARYQRDARLLALDCQRGNPSACTKLAADARAPADTDDEIVGRRAAIRCLADQAVLVDVALGGDVREREAAVENPHFIDQSALALIAAKDGEDLYVREAAIRKLTDRGLLELLAAQPTFALHRAASDRLVALATTR